MEFYPGSLPENTEERRPRSCSLPPPLRSNPLNQPRTRRQSLVLTPKILNEYSKVDEESVSYQKKYDIAHYYVFGTHVRQKSIESSSWPVDCTLSANYKSDPCLGGIGFPEPRKSSLPCVMDFSRTDKNGS